MANSSSSSYLRDPEHIERKRHFNSRKFGRFVLGVVLVASAALGISKLAAESNIDYDNDGEAFHPNGGLPGNYEFIVDPSDQNINFLELGDGNSLSVEQEGSFRNYPSSADIEHPSTILLTNQETKLDDVTKVGYYKDDSSNSYFVIEKDQAPGDVQKYIDEKNIELPKVDGQDVIFINTNDANIEQ